MDLSSDIGRSHFAPRPLVARIQRVLLMRKVSVFIFPEFSVSFPFRRKLLNHFLCHFRFLICRFHFVSAKCRFRFHILLFISFFYGNGRKVSLSFSTLPISVWTHWFLQPHKTFLIECFNFDFGKIFIPDCSFAKIDLQTEF